VTCGPWQPAGRGTVTLRSGAAASCVGTPRKGPGRPAAATGRGRKAVGLLGFLNARHGPLGTSRGRL
jgi:hypothetical protein